jgi:hypothetical protein
MTDTFKAWQCIGCGKIDGPAQCIGVCQDRPVELVNAVDYEAAMALAEQSGARAAALEEVVRRIALTTPRNGEWERTWRALQVQARRALDALPGVTAP